MQKRTKSYRGCRSESDIYIVIYEKYTGKVFTIQQKRYAENLTPLHPKNIVSFEFFLASVFVLLVFEKYYRMCASDYDDTHSFITKSL